MIEFKECASCAAKSGSPTLCSACLHNRAAINKLREALRTALSGWGIAEAHSGWSGSDLPKIEKLRKEFDL